MPIDAECRFTDEVPDYKGVFVKDSDKAIMERLKQEGKLIKREQILHAYPHCWRCGSPLIYRAISSWFVKIEPVKGAMLRANKSVYWVPSHIRDGRFGKWLENARDWAISRNRYWGNPLPIWKCDTCGKTVCVGSRKELADLGGEVPEDLHKHFIDKVTLPCSCGGTMHRIPEVLDCWFESGAMPYAQNHYPSTINKNSNRTSLPTSSAKGSTRPAAGSTPWLFSPRPSSTSRPSRPVSSTGLCSPKTARKCPRAYATTPTPPK